MGNDPTQNSISIHKTQFRYTKLNLNAKKFRYTNLMPIHNTQCQYTKVNLIHKTQFMYIVY